MKALSLLFRSSLAMAAVGLSLGAAAQDPQSNRAAVEAAFVKADTDKDSKLSKKEVAAALPQLLARFESLDRDKDGNLNLEEFARAVMT